MLKTYSIVALASLLVACSGCSPVDPAAALPGKWSCDDEIVLTIESSGKYEWLVPPGSGVQFPMGGNGNEHVRTNEDGSYALLGNWRLKGSSLELDMLGDTDRYSIQFNSATSMVMNSDETYSCTKL